MLARLPLPALLLVLAATSAFGQRPVVEPLPAPADAAPEIDGFLDDPLWEAAPPIGPLTEVEPVEGREPPVDTVVQLAYDRDHLYVALRCEDDPALVRARLMARDANLDPDDRVELWIDTFGAQQFGYWFQIGAAGSRGDALLGDGGARFNKRWDGIWYGRARITRRGWQAELAFPFQTLGFRDPLGTWGFNLRRLRKSDGGEYRWASPLVAYRFFDLSVGGRLEGIEGIRQGVGLDVVPYGKLASTRDRRREDDFSLLADVGADVRYRITPSTTALLTLNTDFAETEVDERQVNLTRFPLFFPEKRDFFLQDSDLFEFGPPAGFGGTPRVLPFFSRRIGRDDDGEPVPILAGLKVAARESGWNVGALGTLLDEHDGTAEKALGVLRVARDLGAESAVGAIVTGGRPERPGDALTGGVDLRLSDSTFFGEGRAATLWGWWLTTQTEGPGGEGDAFGVQARVRTRHWQHEASAVQIDPGFDPRLGFVRRRGIRRYSLETDYTWRTREDGWLRQVEVGVEPSITTSTSDERDTWEVELQWLQLELATLDRITLRSVRRFERVPAPFRIGDGAVVAAGDYHETRHVVSVSSSDRRPLALGSRFETGDIFGGELTRWSIGPRTWLGRWAQVEAEYELFDVDLDSGDFRTELWLGRLDLTLSPEVSWLNFVQYDTDSKDLGVQSRLRWIIEPGKDLFLLAVYGWSKEDHGAPFVPTSQELTVKLEYTLRF